MTQFDSRGTTRSLAILILAIILLSLNLRIAIVSIPPVLELIRADLDLSYASVSLLTTIPVLCMGIFAFAAPSVVRIIGRDSGVFLGIVLITLSTAARLWGQSSIILFASTILVGVGIAISQTLLPSLVSLHFPTRFGVVTGVYTAGMGIGATITAGLTAPIQQWFGSWEVALAIWAILAVVAIAFWIPILRVDPDAQSTQPTPQDRQATSSIWLNPLSIQATIFFGSVSAIFYSVLTWLAPRYVAIGWSEGGAGLLLTIYLFSGLIGMLITSVYTDRIEDRRPLIYVMLSVLVVSGVAVGYVPEFYPWVWAALFGIGTGSLFSLSLILPIDFTENESVTDRLSSLMMGVGYTIAAIGPILIGGVRDLTGSYVPAFAGIVVVSIALLGISVRFKPTRLVHG